MSNETALELLSTVEVAKLLSAGQWSVWRWSRSGAIPAPGRVTAAVRFRRAEILTWIASGCPHCDEGGCR